MLIFNSGKPFCKSMAKIMAKASTLHHPHVQVVSPLHLSPIHQESQVNHGRIHKPDSRFNQLGIEMLPDRLYKQVFGYDQGNEENSHHDYIWRHTIPNWYNTQRCIQHLRRHNLLPDKIADIDTIYEYHKHLSTECDPKLGEASRTADVVMDIPKLVGNNIDEHFNNLGKEFSEKYKSMANDLINKSQKVLQSMPEQWSKQPGWTRYEPLENGFNIEIVSYPLEKAIIFDVETCLNDVVDHAPTMAVALSESAWYSWTSPRLLNYTDKINSNQSIRIQDLIPFKSNDNEEKLIIGHNVGFDRSFLQDQYELKDSKTKFLDTLSLHMCICGLTKLQRSVKIAHNRKVKENEPVDAEDVDKNTWIGKSCLNNLADVYRFHCGATISKDERQIFVDGTMDDVRDNYQSLMTYCAHDVKATFEVFSILFKTFSQRFPHPVTLAGMLEMSTMYLPVNTSNWFRYIENSQLTYDEYEQRLSNSLQNLAKSACGLKPEDYSKDVWLYDIDWSKQSIKPHKGKLNAWLKLRSKQDETEKSILDEVEEIYQTKSFMRQITPFMPGFPKWYRDLCYPYKKAESLLDDKKWQPGPCLITTQMRITPKLMQLTWDGYPLHFNQKHGWGYLVPNDDLVAQYMKSPEGHPYEDFPIESLRSLCSHLPRSHILIEEHTELDERLDDCAIQAKIEELKDNTQLGTLNLMKLLRKLSKKKKVSPRFKNEFCEDVEIPGAYFIKLPHKSGPSCNVGNPLSKDFVSKMEDGTISSLDDNLAKLLLQHSSALSYWKNSQKRIKSQMVVPLGGSFEIYQGVILPRVIVAGTVTRRAVEPTWLTATNHDSSRIGSELKAMIQAPDGYCFVGADVDSQELWIASLMGDSYSYKIHGGTGLSYMTLRGNKSEKTDMHSKTASLIGISRSEAKVLNYARIYGAGQKFIERFLTNTNNQLNEEEAKRKAKTIFKETKGVRRYTYRKSWMNSLDSKTSPNRDKSISIHIPDNRNETELQKTNTDSETNYNYESEAKDLKSKDLRSFWDGGTESATFNKLEEIASSYEPRTPVLNCQISSALEPSQDPSQDFVTSRVNWVVQSSAVDFLHLVLVNMKWLFDRLNIDGRLSITIHDEVRYLVKEEDKYKAAFALQVSNLLVRSYFAYKLKMKDLPISVAFFSSVEIDKCLRKEVDMDCKSPSNPYGLRESYNIEQGESLDVNQILARYSYKS